MNSIRVNNLTKKYNDLTAVNHISFKVEKGNMLGFLGVNGAGKTTVINMPATFLTPDEINKKLKENTAIRNKMRISFRAVLR